MYNDISNNDILPFKNKEIENESLYSDGEIDLIGGDYLFL